MVDGESLTDAEFENFFVLLDAAVLGGRQVRRGDKVVNVYVSAN